MPYSAGLIILAANGIRGMSDVLNECCGEQSGLPFFLQGKGANLEGPGQRNRKKKKKRRLGSSLRASPALCPSTSASPFTK